MDEFTTTTTTITRVLSKNPYAYLADLDDFPEANKMLRVIHKMSPMDTSLLRYEFDAIEFSPTIFSCAFSYLKDELELIQAKENTEKEGNWSDIRPTEVGAAVVEIMKRSNGNVK